MPIEGNSSNFSEAHGRQEKAIGRLLQANGARGGKFGKAASVSRVGWASVTNKKAPLPLEWSEAN